MTANEQPAPATNTSSADDISNEMAAAMDAAMKGAMSAPAAAAPQGEKADANTPHAKPAGLRGPRVVEGGRVHRAGVVVSVGPTDIFVEFGPKELGIVPRDQFPGEDELPKVGQELKVVVNKFESSEGIYICSRPGSVQKAEWELLEPGQVVEARVTGHNKGGLELEIANHRAFMPAGQVGGPIGPGGQVMGDRAPDLSVFVGEKLKCVVVRVDRSGKGNIVLSRREILEQDRKAQAEKLKSTLVEGQTVEGTVRKIMPFGAFVDIGGIDGLVHIGDLTYDRVGFGEKAVQKFVSEGQRVNVRILKLDWENKRISLGLKQTQGDPFAAASGSITEGSEITAKITRVAEFGAFAEIAPGVEGLIHISELDYKRVAKVEDVVKPDQVLQVKIIKIDPGSRRISLSIKALKPAPEMAGGGEGGGGRPGGRGKGKEPSRSVDEIKKETPALRRAREKFKNFSFKGGLS